MRNLATILIVLSFTGYLAFGYFDTARAAICNYSVTLEAKPVSVREDENVVLTATANRSTAGGLLSDCASKVGFSFQYKGKSGSNHTLGIQTVNFSNSKAVATYTVNLKTSYSSIKSNLADPNKIFFTVFYQTLGGDLTTGRTNDAAVSVSGVTSVSGNILVKLLPYQATYKEGDKFAVHVFARSFNLDPAIQSMFLAVKVNGQSNQNIVTQVTNVTRKQFFDGFTTPQITVNSANKFQDKLNTLRVELWQSGTSLKVSEAIVNIQANISGQTGQPTPQPTLPSQPDQSGRKAGEGGKAPDTALTEVLFNPLPVDSLTGVLLYMLRGFLAIIALWGVTFIVIGGFKLIMARGNEEAYLAAKKTITWAILGVAIAMLSFSIIAIVQNLIGVRVPEPPKTENPIIKTKP